MTQQRAVAHERTGVLHEPESPGTRLKGRVDASRRATREFVVKLRILEVAQIERQRLFENHHVDALPQLRAQQRLAQRQPRWAAAMVAISAPSSMTNSTTCRAAPPPARMAATTASTISEPT